MVLSVTFSPKGKTAIALAVFLVFSIANLSFAQEESTETPSTSNENEVSVEESQPGLVTDPEALGYSIEGFPGSEEVIGDFVVGPGKVELEVPAGESRIVELSATNRTGVDRIFKFTTEDAVGTRDGGEAVILLGDDTGPYTLKDYLVIPPEQGILIKHGQRVRIPVTVSVPPDAEPGGRYGSVIVQTTTITSGEGDGTNAVAKSPLITRIGTLFFVTVPGEITRGGELVDFSTIPDKQFFTNGPIQFALTYENTGSIHLNPYGEIEIFNFMGDSVGFVELDPWFALPQSLRFREVSWNRELLMGKYTAVARINRGYDDVIDEQTLTFYVIPLKVVALVFGGLVLFFLLVNFIIKNFEFRRRGNS